MQKKDKKVLLGICLSLGVLILIGTVIVGRNVFVKKTIPENSSSSVSIDIGETLDTDIKGEVAVSHIKSIFSWEDEPYQLSKRADFYATLEQMSIGRVYQSFSSETLYSDDARSFVKECGYMGIELYYLAGKAEWGLEKDARSIIWEIDKVVAFNRSGDDKFSGIIFDVEPYLTDAWKNEEMTREEVVKTYTESMKIAYEYAKSKGVKMIMCIPSWYDSISSEYLETLISSASDEVAVMNYNKSNEIKGMETEVAFAKKYNKPISCIFEFQEPGKHSLTENETYYNQGLTVAKESFETLYQHFDYSSMGFAYHYYKSVLELIKMGRI